MTKKTVTKVNTLPKLESKKRVAAYARVSTGKDAMLHSLSAQVNHYKKLIQENSEWTFIGVYADEALTGTKESRKEFQQLLKDCRAGQIDMVITKSISRFARNTVTLLKTVRELKAINVDVFFEEQNIHSISGEGEMILTFLATFAQEESRSVSENMKWRIKRDFEKGIIWGSKSCLGYKLENKQLILIPDEAEVVRMIFKLYINGNGADTIGKILQSKGIKPTRSKVWNRSSIMGILSNYNYTGDLILQKTYVENHLSKRKILNAGELDRYIVKDAHEAIVSKDIFNQAQKVRKKQAQKINTGPYQEKRTFRGMMRCGICGKAYTYRTTAHNEIWRCSLAVTKGSKACSAKQVPDKMIKEAANYILGMDEFNEAYFNSVVKTIIVMPENRLVFHMKDESSKGFTWKDRSRKESWTPEMRKQARLRALKQHKGGVQND